MNFKKLFNLIYFWIFFTKNCHSNKISLNESCLMNAQSKIVLNTKNIVSDYASINVYNFNKFSIFNFDCIFAEKYALSFNFLPNKKLVLDKSLEFTLSKTANYNGIGLKFLKIKAFELYSNIFYKLKKKFESIRFYYSNFKIISGDADSCSPSKNKDIFFFKNVLNVGFGFSVRYYRQTCPLIFSNSDVIFIEFYGLSDTFLKNNSLGFLFLNITIKNNLEKVYINSYKINLNKNLLSPEIFKNCLFLTLRGSYKYLEKDTFSNLDQLVLIDLYIDNIRDFMNRNFYFLKQLISYKHSRIIQITIMDENQFPNEDLCLYKEFYYSNVTNVIVTGQFVNCTDTIKMLVSNPNLDESILKIIIDHRINLSFSSCSLNQDVREKILQSMLKRCEHHVSIEIKKSTNYSDKIYNSEILNLVSIILPPLFCLITIFTNLANLKILSNIKSSSSSRLMILNSVINLVYSVIFAIHLINRCVYINGIFCSTILTNKYVQLFDIIFVEFFLAILKIWSNVSLIGISWLRLAFLIKDKTWVKRIEKFLKKKSSKICLVSLLIMSVLISIDKLFLVRVNERYFIMDEEYYEEFPDKNNFISVLYRDVGNGKNEQSKNVLFSGTVTYIFYLMYFLNFILNDFLIYLLMFSIDIIMLFYLRRQIKSKKKLRLNFNLNNDGNLENAEARISYTVITNLIIVFLLKSLHLAVSIYLLIIKTFSNKRDKLNICFYYSRFCSNLLEFTELFYLLSNAYTIILYCNLNKNFKLSFEKIFFSKKITKNKIQETSLCQSKI